MTLWKKARMDSLFYDGEADVGLECEVRIDERSIVVSYQGDDGYVNYSGANDGSGHFELRADRYDGHASLHMFPHSHVLEGFWAEKGTRGMWRIVLE